MINKLIKYLNAYTSLSLCIQLHQNSLILIKDNDRSDYLMHHNEKKYPLDNKKLDVEENQKDLPRKSSNNKSKKNILPKYIS